MREDNVCTRHSSHVFCLFNPSRSPLRKTLKFVLFHRRGNWGTVGRVIHLRSHSWLAELGFEPQGSGSKACGLTMTLSHASIWLWYGEEIEPQESITQSHLYEKWKHVLVQRGKNGDVQWKRVLGVGAMALHFDAFLYVLLEFLTASRYCCN